MEEAGPGEAQTTSFLQLRTINLFVKRQPIKPNTNNCAAFGFVQSLNKFEQSRLVQLVQPVQVVQVVMFVQIKG